MPTMYSADQLQHPPPPDPPLCCESDEDGAGGGGFADLNGNGSPVGVVTPDIINQKYRDDLNDRYYWATGLTSADWHQWG